MKKIIKGLATSILLIASSQALADRDGHGWGHHGHHRHHHDYDRGYNRGPVFFTPPAPLPIIREHVRYYPQPVVQVPAPVYYQERIIYEQPPAPVYQPAPVYYGDRRTQAGLVGGAIGSAIGYEASRGDPLAAGIGAAAGALLGNTIR